MAEQDYAIVVGISRYPKLGPEQGPLDLHGPDADVDAILAWLQDSAGGAVPVRNTLTIRCPSPPVDGVSEPTQASVERALVWLQALASANQLGSGGYPVGRRLYIYMSGHGFSSLPDRACLYTAEAQADYGQNVHATGWLSWLQDANLFRELVLWMDCCMDGVGFKPGDPAVRLLTPKQAPGPSFVAFAAPRPLRAVERADPDNPTVWHGVFTSLLLEGLRGAAVDTNGRITGRSLGDWLRASLAGRLSPSDVADLRIAKEPMIVRDDPDIIFGRGLQAHRYSVQLTFPANAFDQSARLWQGSPPTAGASFLAGANGNRLLLRPGLYLIEVPTVGLRHGFAVTGPVAVDVVDTDMPVQPDFDDTMFALNVATPANAGHDIRVADHRLVTADAANGTLDVRLPFGLYKIRVSTGRTLQERVILLDRDQPPFDAALVNQPSPAVAPLAGTAAASSYQAGLAEQTRAAACVQAAPDQAVITVLARTYEWASNSELLLPWSDGIEVVNAAGLQVLSLADTAPQVQEGDRCAVASKPVPPGSYFLRYKVHGQAIEQSLVAVAGWSIDATLLFRRPESGEPDGLPRVSILMRSMKNERWDAALDARAEAARLALVDERDILSGPLGDLLLTSFDDPMTGLMGAHLLLIANSKGLHNLAPLPGMIAKLQGMAGQSHPDVQALELAIAGQDGPAPPLIAVPPMFARSWSLIVGADARFEGLVPVDLWRRVRAQSSLAPYLAWATSKATQTNVSRELTGLLAFAVRSAAGQTGAMIATVPMLASATQTSMDAISSFRSSTFGEALMAHVDDSTLGNILSYVPAISDAIGTTDLLNQFKVQARGLGIPVAAVEDLISGLMTQERVQVSSS